MEQTGRNVSGLKSPSDSFVNAAYEFSGLISIVESANDVVAAVFRGDVSSEFIVLQSIIYSTVLIHYIH